MSFLGPVTRLAGRLVRPHDLEVPRTPRPGSVAAAVERVVRLGFEVRVDAVAGGEPIWAQLTREGARRLSLQPGDTVHIRARHPRPSSPWPEPPAERRRSRCDRLASRSRQDDERTPAAVPTLVVWRSAPGPGSRRRRPALQAGPTAAGAAVLPGQAAAARARR